MTLEKFSKIAWCSCLVGLLALIATPATHACHDGSPLILDLNGDGLIRTTGETHPVSFDLDADGHQEQILWTFWEDGDGFLFLDHNSNKIVDDGSELFGDATVLPSGEVAPDGFTALAVFDRVEHGGDSDGVITNGDMIWRQLRVWVDRNHDGRSQRSEITPLERYGILGIGLEATETDARDGHGNGHYLQGTFVQRESGHGPLTLAERPVHDVFFRVLHEDEHDH